MGPQGPARTQFEFELKKYIFPGVVETMGMIVFTETVQVVPVQI
jgi:hypothetical protein